MDKELKTEFEFYLSQPNDWKKQNQGKLVVIKEGQIHKIFESYNDAFSYGVETFGNVKFLIQEMGSEDIVHYTTQGLLGIA